MDSLAPIVNAGSPAKASSKNLAVQDLRVVNPMQAIKVQKFLSSVEGELAEANAKQARLEALYDHASKVEYASEKRFKEAQDQLLALQTKRESIKVSEPVPFVSSLPGAQPMGFAPETLLQSGPSEPEHQALGQNYEIASEDPLGQLLQEHISDLQQKVQSSQVSRKRMFQEMESIRKERKIKDQHYKESLSQAVNAPMSQLESWTQNI